MLSSVFRGCRKAAPGLYLSATTTTAATATTGGRQLSSTTNVSSAGIAIVFHKDVIPLVKEAHNVESFIDVKQLDGSPSLNPAKVREHLDVLGVPTASHTFKVQGDQVSSHTAVIVDVPDKDATAGIADTIKDTLSSCVADPAYPPNICSPGIPLTQLKKAREALAAVYRDANNDDGSPFEVRGTRVGDFSGVIVSGIDARNVLHQIFADIDLLTVVNQVWVESALNIDGTAHPVLLYPYRFDDDTTSYIVFASQENSVPVFTFLRDLSKGRLATDSDPFLRIPGRYRVSDLSDEVIDSASMDLLNVTFDMVDPAKIVENPKFFSLEKSFHLKNTSSTKPGFEYKPDSTELQRTKLYDWHIEQGAKMAPFGGWDMPIQYPSTGLLEEHKAVRTAGGLFDVSHMTAVAVEGDNAAFFLDAALATMPSQLRIGQAHYSYLLQYDGVALDDLYVYRVGKREFLLVVNAATSDQDVQYLKALVTGDVLLSRTGQGPQQIVGSDVVVENLRDSLIGIAFQGPLAAQVSAELTASKEEKTMLLEKPFNTVFDVTIAGIPTTVTRTGYTGEEVAFEMFCAPEKLGALWDALLSQGEERGVRAIGLGARDSLRIEAGLPLFGHELEGPEHLSLNEAGYGFVPALHHPFVGREAYLERLCQNPRKLIRLKGEGRKTVRAGHAILNENGEAIGTVTSSSFVDKDFNFIALATVPLGYRTTKGMPITAARASPEQITKKPDPKKHVELSCITRFPTKAEKQGWQQQYSLV